ncbi:MAG: PIN domain-containing protein [Candidatus Pacearchaeota archaeon]|jgi:predicted nucleic acid-binding protein
MKLVVDTSIIFSLFKSDSETNKLLKEYKFELYAPKEMLEELSKYSDLICSKSGVSKIIVLENISLLPNLIDFRNASNFFELEAEKLISHKTDVPFLALALELNIPIWSNDLHFKEQCSVKVFTTTELKKLLDSFIE